ncbi:MAG: hypothetical protein M0C28_35160 [Candidatus Moduliflexus flocculans]|nr:hypothetical protein [Candidatus Moduliflexus flocculans]
MKRFFNFRFDTHHHADRQRAAAHHRPHPPINPLDLQSTAVAAALTILAETQAAIPTATPPSPTVGGYGYTGVHRHHPSPADPGSDVHPEPR